MRELGRASETDAVQLRSRGDRDGRGPKGDRDGRGPEERPGRTRSDERCPLRAGGAEHGADRLIVVDASNGFGQQRCHRDDFDGIEPLFTRKWDRVADA